MIESDIDAAKEIYAKHNRWNSFNSIEFYVRCAECGAVLPFLEKPGTDWDFESFCDEAIMAHALDVALRSV